MYIKHDLCPNALTADSQTSAFAVFSVSLDVTYTYPHSMRMFMKRLNDLIQLSINKGEARKERKNF